MKILKANAGPLTNLEVLEFLRSRGAGKDPTRVIAPVAPSEFKVFDYLEQSAIRNQTRESINEFVVKSKKYNFSKAETLNIINNIPSSAPELYTMVTESTSHVKDEDELAVLLEEMVAMVAEVFPPNKMEPGDGACENIDAS